MPELLLLFLLFLLPERLYLLFDNIPSCASQYVPLRDGGSVLSGVDANTNPCQNGPGRSRRLCALRHYMVRLLYPFDHTVAGSIHIPGYFTASIDRERRTRPFCG